MKSRLISFYNESIKKAMADKFKYKNDMMVPKIEKIVLSMGFNGKQKIAGGLADLTKIAGQKAVITKAKKSISQFSLRAGNEIGVKVTLRGNLMYHFLDRLVNIALLNWRSFNGLFKRSFNVQKKNISLSIGIVDQRIFPEIKTDAIKSEGLNVTICTNSKTRDEALELLSLFNLPFRG